MLQLSMRTELGPGNGWIFGKSWSADKKNFSPSFSLIRMGSRGTFMLCTASWGSVLLLPLPEFKAGPVLFFAGEAQQSISDSCLQSVWCAVLNTCTAITVLWPYAPINVMPHLPPIGQWWGKYVLSISDPKFSIRGGMFDFIGIRH